jgi:hypothetical protein
MYCAIYSLFSSTVAGALGAGYGALAGITAGAVSFLSAICLLL